VYSTLRFGLALVVERRACTLLMQAVCSRVPEENAGMGASVEVCSGAPRPIELLLHAVARPGSGVLLSFRTGFL
jgi:hypothetical protein